METFPGNETLAPILPTVDPDETLAFWGALGFVTTYDQRRPYVYLAVRFSGIELNFGAAPDGLDPARENSGGVVVSVDEVAPYHAAFVAGMRAAHGKVLGRGVPRITGCGPGPPGSR